MSEWKNTKLEEVLTFGNGKVKPKNNGAIPIYGGNGILGFGNKSNYDGETIIIGRVGAYCGSVYYENKPIWVSDNALSAKPKGKNNAKFLYYFLKQIDLNQWAGGSSHPLVTQTLLNSLEFSICINPNTQASTASILSSLDDKINLLHRQNATLEKMGETLFRQWFIEDAKEREKTKIGLVLETVLGGTPSTNNSKYWDGTIPWINSGEVNNFRILKPTKFITELALVESNTKLLPIGTTVLAITGATLGQISLLEISTCANQSVVGIIPNEIYPKEYVFLWIKYMIDEIILNETGGAQPHINKNDVNETEILIPCNDDLEFIESKIKPLFKKISINSFQINTLVELRDSLLPRLMSGEITVNQG